MEHIQKYILFAHILFLRWLHGKQQQNLPWSVIILKWFYCLWLSFKDFYIVYMNTCIMYICNSIYNIQYSKINSLMLCMQTWPRGFIQGLYRTRWYIWQFFFLNFLLQHFLLDPSLRPTCKFLILAIFYHPHNLVYKKFYYIS